MVKLFCEYENLLIFKILLKVVLIMEEKILLVNSYYKCCLLNFIDINQEIYEIKTTVDYFSILQIGIISCILLRKFCLSQIFHWKILNLPNEALNKWKIKTL